MTKFSLNGKKDIDLGKKDFIAQGGEGMVYVKRSTAYKIYCDQKNNPDPSKMIDINKIKELSVLSNPYIIKPKDIVYLNKKAVGYTMDYVKDTYTLCQIFTKAFKNRYNISNENVMDLICKLQNIIKHAHQNDILIVDLNEMNFLLSQDFKNVYAIDVDSWQTKNFPATAIMDSIRDRQVKNGKFTKDSDWFSYAVISFQMLIGIHPYKGKHKLIKHWTERMDKNVSVFNKDVTVPKICMPFDVIPNAFKEWLKAVLEDGKRISPPDDPNELVVIFTPKIRKVGGINNFVIDEYFEFPEKISHTVFNVNKNITLSGNEIFVDKRKINNAKSSKSQFVFSESNKLIEFWVEENKTNFMNLTDKENISFHVNCDNYMVNDNRLYIKNGSQLQEIQFKEMAGKVFVTQKKVANIMENSSYFYDGVIIQNMLGKIYAVLCPYSENSFQINLKEIENEKIITAKYMNKILMIITEKSGIYNRYVIRFNSDFNNYDIREVKDITYMGINFIVNEKGVCICINEDENIELFTNQLNNQDLKIIEDKNISADMKLVTNGLQTYFFKDRKLYKIKSK